MNKQELISMYERISNFSENVNTKKVIANLQQLDKPQAGHAEKAPCYLRNVIARLRELPLHDREVWLQAIMAEFEEDFCHSIWREGYEQGKFEGAWVGEQLKDADKIRRELNRPVVPQFVADWIKYCKFTNVNLQNALFVGDVYFYSYANQKDFSKLKEFLETENNQATFVRAWLDGYEVEEEKRYLVKVKGLEKKKCYLNYNFGGVWLIYNQDNFGGYRAHHTRKELEEAGFLWVFDCPGIEVEEVEG